MLLIVRKEDLAVIHRCKDTPKPWESALPAPEFIHVEVPPEMDVDCVIPVASQVILDDVPTTQYTVEEEPTLLAEKAIVNKKIARDKLLTDLLAELKQKTLEVYGTTSETGALADYLSWMDMVANPSLSVGPIFPDEATVIAYATPKIAASRAFGLWRIARLLQHSNDVTALETT